MMYRSTRGAQSVKLDDALVSGIASDGGLYLPESLPSFRPDDFSGADELKDVAYIVLEPLFKASSLASDLEAIINETFSFPIPVVDLPVETGSCRLLELFHGPTAAFKDVGARFLAACLVRLQGDIDYPLTILVATSGDTGGAVAAAFNERPGIRVVVLYPDGRVSERQEQQLTCWGDNVLSLAIQGSFDQCQGLVKEAMADEALTKRHRFSSANSINIGRLLPQTIYYAYSSLSNWRKNHREASFIVPTGNLGNAFACYLARKMGLPIDRLTLATNSNRIIVDFLSGQEWLPSNSIRTLASAMDVGNPSNMERLRADGGEATDLAEQITAKSVSDEEIQQDIRRNFSEFGYASCPHTATASFVWRTLSTQEKLAFDWILVATAHAAKFEQTVEPLIGEEVPVPRGLKDILKKDSNVLQANPSLPALAVALDESF